MDIKKKELLKGLNGQFIKRTNAVGYCRLHGVALTKTDLKNRECLKKQCGALKRYEENYYWAERERIKQLRRARKERLKGL